MVCSNASANTGVNVPVCANYTESVWLMVSKLKLNQGGKSETPVLPSYSPILPPYFKKNLKYGNLAFSPLN